MKLATIIGTRPQFIKAATVSRLIKEISSVTEVIIHTGQHYDDNMSEVFFKQLQIPQPHYNLEVGSGSHGQQTGLMLQRIEQVLIKEKPDWVLIYGDTNSTIAGALAAVKLHILTAHVEAGLRSFNRKMPEEINRIATDRVSDVLFAPTQNAMDLLQKEGLEQRAVFSGDVMYDSILFYSELLNESHRPPVLDSLDAYYLATIHRPENTDNPQHLQSIFSAFSELDLPVVLPLHPRTRNLLDGIRYNENVKIIDPVGYLQMLYLLRHSFKVLTDSGGLQKEAYFMQKPCLTLRDQSEWVETLEGNWNFIVAANKDMILEKIQINEYGPQTLAFGNGRAAKKIVDHLTNKKRQI
ncbi:MAG TPA: UDP-N-acetylglucosamine 2-epimerase (non-hydrolyzing) [Caldithrix abyssi]|uniref:UDP-N-acetylglucosamine 2-epimerase (Non-hydrolyzing) n=1 Tax=Caldithrix abyssi TaxID=187145 RepID=A0A7V4WX78_CALAY|nr:UDP-N-acetylglucosamine 2-epimerase (non-hydrolyzing) [Caldithrix abyssi]